MERTALTCFIIFIIFGSYEGVTAWKPTMIPTESEIVLQEGDELKLECHGEGKMNFSMEQFRRAKTQSNFSLLIDETYGNATLIRPNTIRQDAGWYGCAREDVVVENDDETIEHPTDEISWIYVYVNSSTPFVVMDSEYETILVDTGSTAIIPCRSTSPDLSESVIYELFYDETPPHEQSRYDPKIGFIIEDIQKIRSEEIYTCKMNSTDQIYNVTWPFYTLIVSDSHPVQTPVINETSVNHVVWGENRTISCSFTASRNANFDLRWIAPKPYPSSRFHFPRNSILKVNKVQETVVWKTELTIIDVEKSDAGQYTCMVEGVGRNNRAESSREIKIWDPNYTYVNITLDGDGRPISVNEKESVQWVVEIDTYPEEFDLVWYGPNGRKIEYSEDVGSAKFSHSRNGSEHVFRISRLSIDNSGNYSVHVTTKANASSIILQLRVLLKPIVQIRKNISYSLPQQLVNFSCKIMGSPLPDVAWGYMEYPDYPLKRNSELKFFSNVDNKTVIEGVFHLTSYLNITINMTGELICKSCNEVDCTNSTELILVSDVGDSFGIVDPGLVTEGDNINLTCGASLYNFTDNVTWELDESRKQELKLGRRVVIKRKTNFTSLSILSIRDVKKSDAGNYSCEVEDKEGHTEMMQYSLSVQGTRKPYIIKTNMNDSDIFIDLNKEKNKRLKLQCSAEGHPIPKVTWYKNKDVIAPSAQYNFSPDNSTLEIAYFLNGESARYSCNATNRIGYARRYVDIKIKEKLPPQNITLWISLICVLIVVIIMVITYMGIKVHRERVLRKELSEAGLTHFVEGALECLNRDLTVDDQAELLPYDKKWEFPREQLKLGKQLGSGAFGVVMKAEARGICEGEEVTTVAVKMVRRSAEPSYMKALSSELKIMIHLGRHLNVVNLLGACTKTILTKRELYVIVEYCRFGNLHNYLQRHRASFVDQIDPSTGKIDSTIGLERLVRNDSVDSQNRLKYAALSFSRSVSIKSSDSSNAAELVDYRQGTDFADVSMSPDGGVLSNNSVQPGWRSNYRGDYKDQNLKPICTQDLLCWAWQVSRGMDYLSARKVLHGDLAARNILLADDNVVKICDFGLAKNMYKDDNYKKKGDGPLPIKWMAIESIRDRMFSTQSDVWSFGIVLWEFFTLARSPYPGMEAEKQYDRLIEGYRMEIPEYATDEIYEFMLQCWKAKPSLRPTFPELVVKFGTLLNDSIRTHYLDLNTPYMDMNTLAMQSGQSDYLSMMSSPTHDYLNSPDPSSEMRPDSAYLSMSPLENGRELGVFSPRSVLEESHFNFPPRNKNTPIHSDSEDCVESAPMLTPEDPYLKPIDVQQRRAEFVKQRKEQVPIERDSGYSNVLSNPRSPGSNILPSSDVVNDSDENPNETKLLKNNNKDLSPPIISGPDNYVNMPQQKVDRFKDTVDSFSNPSYVIMSKSEQGRQFL